MKTEFKAHPLMVLSQTAPFLFVLIIPLTRAVLQYLLEGEIHDVLGFEAVILALIAVISVARCVSFRVIYSRQKVIIKKGFIFKSCSEIKLKEISCVEMRQNLIDLCVGAVTFCINTEAGCRKKADFSFKLKLKDGKALSSLVYGENKFKAVRFSPFKVAFWAISTSSAFTGLIIGVPIINNLGRLLKIGLSQMLLNEINEISSEVETYFPPIVNAVTLIFILAYGISFVYSFAKYIKFRLFLNEKRIKVFSGFFVKSKTVFSKKSINDIRIEQTLLMILFKRFSMKASVGGFGTMKDRAQIIVPSGKNSEIKRDFQEYFPFLLPDGDAVAPQKNKRIKTKFLYWPTVGLFTIPIFFSLCSIRFREFSGLILFLTFITLCFLFYYAYICKYEYRHACFKIGKSFSAQSAKFFRTCKMYCDKEKIGQIKIRQYFTDKKQGICRITFLVSSQNADKIRIRHLNLAEVKAEINKNFNTSV